MQHQISQRVNFRGITSESVASVIIRAARRRRSEVIISLPAKCLALGQRISPRLMDWAITLIWNRLAYKQQ
jgi:short-subunit dehydrogenase